LKVVAEGRDSGTVRLGELVDGAEVVTIGADDSAEEAIRTMKDHAVDACRSSTGDLSSAWSARPTSPAPCPTPRSATSSRRSPAHHRTDDDRRARRRAW